MLNRTLLHALRSGKCCLVLSLSFFVSSLQAQAQAPAAAPASSSSLYALQDDNLVLFRATPAGLHQVQEALRGTGITPRLVQPLDADTAEGLRRLRALVVAMPAVQIRLQIRYVSPVAAVSPAAKRLDPTKLLAQLTAKGATIVDSPPLVAPDGTVATSEFRKNVPYSGTTRIGSKDVSTTNYLLVENKLSVTPKINPDGTLSLSVLASLGHLIPTTKPGVPPTVQEQKLQITRTVRSGDTIVIGNNGETLVFLTATVAAQKESAR